MYSSIVGNIFIEPGMSCVDTKGRLVSVVVGLEVPYEEVSHGIGRSLQLILFAVGIQMFKENSTSSLKIKLQKARSKFVYRRSLLVVN